MAAAAAAAALIAERIAAAVVERHPFPHVVIDDALPADLARRVRDEYPPLETFTRGRAHRDNRKYHRSGPDLLADPAVSPGWHHLVEHCLDPVVHAATMRLFAADIPLAFPRLAHDFGDPARWEVGVRHRDTHRRGRVLIDAQAICHAPVLGPPCVERGPHIKIENKIYEGHLFLRDDDDPAEDFELRLYAKRPGARLLYGPRNQVEPSLLTLEKRIATRHNRLFLWLLGRDSFLACGPRDTSSAPLRSFGIVAELPGMAFNLPRPGDSWWRRLARRFA